MSLVQFKAVWPILGLIDSKLRQKIKVAYVFGGDGNSVLFLTTDDDVYSFGTDANNYGYLGHGNGVKTLLQPKKIDVLSKKGIHLLAIGSIGYVLAATTNNEIYAWGYGQSNNLGNGVAGQVYVPAAITANFGGHHITKLACGYTHTLALTDDGEIYSWGTKDYSQLGHSQNGSGPQPITASIGGKFVCDIACAQYSSYAILDNGELYGWGSNAQGQIGTNTSGNTYAEPIQVTSLKSVVIKQIVCGRNFFLALSRSGHVYACGEGTSGQIGKGDVANATGATQLPEKLGSFSQVAATNASDLCAALNDAGEVYVWGRCRFELVKSPMKSELSSLDDAFACYSSPPVTWRPLSIVSAVPKRYGGDVLTSLKNCLVENEEITDITFILENKKIRAHKSILMIRSEYFRRMFQNDWVEKEKEGITIQGFTYNGFNTYIEYVYTGTITNKLSFDVAVDLLQIAECYQEMKLKGLCEELLKDKLQITNCVYLYQIATQFQAELLRVECAKFGAHHMTAFIASDYFKQMTDLKIIKDFLVATGQYGAFKY
ncbi:putative RCC1 and BTB domain-containing protein 1 [Apostichopus japonicus]|uniref:Putative RCC1 and BTB domain-containing protein 1 n=1 Tax=Stichopus japonicus TaxID=307972 RepID=A0A2G8LGX2_STIJA|nr:putative RCC1 and BTB domain-containing protein 1 [Apostichopus japonicus]